MKILVAEDNSDIRMLHQRQLSNWGYNVDLAINGKEAVEHVQKSSEKGAVNYDLCLMDINMPVMSGIEAIQKIRRNTTYLPVIAYSANPDNKTPSLQAGADEFLLKPLPAKALKEKLEECAVKKIALYLDNESLSMHRVGPANSQERNKLKTLDKKGLAQITVIDTSHRFLTHKTAQNKLIHDLGEGNNNIISTELLDRTEQGHNLIQIHAAQISIQKISLTPEEFQQHLKEENEILKKYEKP